MNMSSDTVKELLTLPNLLTCFRFFSAPAMLFFAWVGNGNLFLLLLAITFLSDVLDGMAARFLGQESELGALLDSWADLLVYITIAVSAWWLWPEVMKREIGYVVITILSYFSPAAAGLYKFRAVTSYHTWLVKCAVAVMGTSLFLLFILEIVWPFRLAAFICLLSAAEEIAITYYLPELRSNVRSLWHLTGKKV
jgi:CDP-diacylglycerol--glycerol-3-phosphate 3-phosphatidyltransferase